MTTESQRSAERARTSRAIHRVNELTTSPVIAVAVASVVVAAFAVIVASGFDQGLQVAFDAACAGTTVMMVFVLQHAQRREQTAVQLKLNEIVRALARADDHLIGVEASPDRELVDLEQSQLDHHASLRDNGAAPEGGDDERG